MTARPRKMLVAAPKTPDGLLRLVMARAEALREARRAA